MTTQDLVLNIAVNLGRLSRWAVEGKTERINQFLKDTDYYFQELENSPKNDRFLPTFHRFKQTFNQLKKEQSYDKYWAEDALTWANILSHRTQLA